MKPNESPTESASAAASPFPPAFRWEAAQQKADAPAQVMGTQMMGAVGRDVGSEHTPAMSPSPDYQQRPGEAGDLFQPVGTVAGEPNGHPDGGSAPPWAGSDLPPIAKQPVEQPLAEQPLAQQPIAEQQSAWLRQGPEVFQAPAMQARSKQVVGIAVLGGVLLGLLGAMVAYFLTAHSADRTGLDPMAAAQPTAAARALADPPAPLAAPVDTEHALIDPPGQSRGGGGLFDLPKLKSTSLLRPEIQNVLQTGGMTEGVLKTTTVGANTIGMFALTMPDQQAATTVAQEIATVQLDGGLKADNNRALRGVAVMGSVPGSQPTAYRAVYVLYNRAIFFEVFGPNRDAVLTTFDFVLNQQVNYAPPTVRVGR
ncbi:MAG TPA: hypothetical protein VGP04_05965 [Pseudonocardiaceae bacterium]|nr:hypothetical protein [Pseudonocardiaceae bacterium]